MATPKRLFALGVRGDGSEDLEPRKLYQVLPDRHTPSLPMAQAYVANVG
jgi:hypothetical protein